MSDLSLAKGAALAVEGLVVRFPDKTGGTFDVLKDITFDVKEGEFVSVMGPSGCGKSTLLNVLAGFLPATAGRVTFNDEPITRPAANRGMVFQSPALYPWLNVIDNVLFGPRATGRKRGAEQRARALLAEVGLEGFERHRPYELSGGMRHRVALARTLANEPPVLLMDEPFAALDAQTRSDMQALLLDVWQRHKVTVVFVTHDIEEGLVLADRAVVLSKTPAVVREVIDVPFLRPRSYEIVLTPEFVQLRGQLRDLLRRSDVIDADAGKRELRVGHGG